MFKKLFLAVVFSLATILWSSYSFAGACSWFNSMNPDGVDAGQYPQQYELSEFEQCSRLSNAI